MSIDNEISILVGYTEQIDNIFQESSVKPCNEYIGKWMFDDTIKYNIDSIKKCSQRVSHACTKFSTILMNTTSFEAIESFLVEFMPYVATYMDFYRYIQSFSFYFTCICI